MGRLFDFGFDGFAYYLYNPCLHRCEEQREQETQQDRNDHEKTLGEL